MGVDYLAATLAAQAGVPPELAKEGMDRFVAAVESSSCGTGPVGLDFLKLDPDFQYKPAIMIVEVHNPYNQTTLPGTLEIENHETVHHDIHKQYYTDSVFRPVTMPIPPLQPGQKIDIPIFLVENNNYFNLSVCNPLPLPVGVWGTMYYYGKTEFKVNVCCVSTDPQEVAKELGQIYCGIEYVYYGDSYDSVEISTSEVWSK
jgi:hypothetical protein